MRYCAPIGAFAFIVSLSASAGVLKDETDRFTGSRVVIWNSLPSKADDFSLSTVALYSKGSPTPGYYRVQLMTWSDSGQFMECHHTNWLVDGTLDPYLEFEYSSASAGSAVLERFDKQMDRTNLQRLASAKLIEFQVCGTEGKVSQSDMDGMRKVLEATK
ncbi:hypothetical protein D3C87_1188750 [compost metagenome]